MINLTQFEENIKKNKLDNCYIFCGIDEELIKESIRSFIDKILDKNFIDLNYVKFDGDNLYNFSGIVNACETLPFISDKKVVLVYRANFLGEGEDNTKKRLYNEFKEYIKDILEEYYNTTFFEYSNHLDYLFTVDNEIWGVSCFKKSQDDRIGLKDINGFMEELKKTEASRGLIVTNSYFTEELKCFAIVSAALPLDIPVSSISTPNLCSFNNILLPPI